jgi:hypothetical protein
MLDYIPADAQRITIKIVASGGCTDTDAGAKATLMNYRRHGSSVSASAANRIMTLYGGGSGGYAKAATSEEHTVNLGTNKSFDLILANHDFSSGYNGQIFLVGYDFNPPS